MKYEKDILARKIHKLIENIEIRDNSTIIR